MKSYERFINALRDAGSIVVERGQHRATAQAPGHSPADRSISILYNPAEGRTAFMSFADDREQVLDTLGLTWSDLFDDPKGSRYDYGDGRQVWRTPDKKFRQSGNTKGTQLFHADRIPAADTVYLVEGEHDVLTLEAEGVTATCTAMGAGKAHLFDLTPLHGKNVIIVQDQDAPGAAHANQLAELLAPHADVKIVAPKVGKDAADHIVSGHTINDFTPVDTATTNIALSVVAKAVEDAKTMPLADGIDHIRSALSRIAPVEESGPKPMLDWVNKWWDWVQTDPTKGAGRIMSTPWPDLDELLAGGFHAGRSYLIAGRPGAGKSIGLINFAAHAATVGGYRGLLYSVEMGGVEVTSRIIASGANAEYKQITRRQLDERNYAAVMEYADRLQTAPLFISDRSSVTISRIATEARRHKENGGLDFIAVDYMQLLKSSESDRQRALTNISREVKVLAGELDVVMLSACQLNRGNAKDNRKPMLSDLRESGALEQDCDVCILLHHTEEEGFPTGEVELIVAKNRTGPMATVTLPWRPHYARIGY